MRKVVKFGGSSLASAQQFKKVAEIVHAEASRRYVVPSAPGKRFRKDTKVTDMLYGCYALAEQEPILIRLCRMAAVFSTACVSSGESGSKCSNVLRLSSSWSSALMPERIMRHPAESI